MSTIAELLRNKDLALKKVTKDSTRFMAYTTVVGDGKAGKDFELASSYFQSVYDQLINVCNLTSHLRRANISTSADYKNFFGHKMSVIDCRQNLVGDKNVGMPSTVYYLRELYNHILEQVKSVGSSVKSHNDKAKLDLKKTLDNEYTSHLKERDTLTKMGASVDKDFEQKYEEKVANMTEAFWKKQKAIQVDPLGIFEHLLNELGTWLNDFEKNRETVINKANHNSIGKLTTEAPNENSETVSLEELMSFIKDKSSEIKTQIGRLVVVSWRVSDEEPKNLVVSSAEQDLSNVLSLIETYGKMQNSLRYGTAVTSIGFKSPLTGSQMSAIDVVDFQHIVLPVFEQMLNQVKTQNITASTEVKSREPTVRAEVIKLLENSMSSASSRPTPEKMKEYTNNLLDSMMPKLVVANGVETWIKKFEDTVDLYNSDMKLLLSTTNANTRVQVTWTNLTVPPVNMSWESLDNFQTLVQPELTNNLNHGTEVANTTDALCRDEYGFGRGRGGGSTRGRAREKR